MDFSKENSSLEKIEMKSFVDKLSLLNSLAFLLKNNIEMRLSRVSRDLNVLNCNNLSARYVGLLLIKKIF